MTSEPPIAPIVGTRSNRVTVHCPYCGQRHDHAVSVRAGDYVRVAPGCGLYRTPEQRATGYRIQRQKPAVPPERRGSRR